MRRDREATVGLQDGKRLAQLMRTPIVRSVNIDAMVHDIEVVGAIVELLRVEPMPDHT